MVKYKNLSSIFNYSNLVSDDAINQTEVILVNHVDLRSLSKALHTGVSERWVPYFVIWLALIRISHYNLAIE